MAEQGMLPAVLAVRSEHGSPKLGLLLSSIGIFFMMFSTFTEVVELLNFLYCIAQLLELAAFMYLRIYAKDLPRKFVVPLNTWGCAAMLTLPVVFIFFIMSQATMRTIYISAAVVVAGPLFYQIIELARRQQVQSVLPSRGIAVV
jgi:amino acid transporter